MLKFATVWEPKGSGSVIETARTENVYDSPILALAGAMKTAFYACLGSEEEASQKLQVLAHFEKEESLHNPNLVTIRAIIEPNRRGAKAKKKAKFLPIELQVRGAQQYNPGVNVVPMGSFWPSYTTSLILETAFLLENETVTGLAAKLALRTSPYDSRGEIPFMTVTVSVPYLALMREFLLRQLATPPTCPTCTQK